MEHSCQCLLRLGVNSHHKLRYQNRHEIVDSSVPLSPELDSSELTCVLRILLPQILSYDPYVSHRGTMEPEALSESTGSSYPRKHDTICNLEQAGASGQGLL